MGRPECGITMELGTSESLSLFSFTFSGVKVRSERTGSVGRALVGGWAGAGEEWRGRKHKKGTEGARQARVRNGRSDASTAQRMEESKRGTSSKLQENKEHIK